MPKALPKIITICEVCNTPFGRTPAFHRSAESKGGKVRFCSMVCFGKAKTSGLVKVVNKAGKTAFTCEMCKQPFYRWPSDCKWSKISGKTIRFCSRKCHGAARTARIIKMPVGTNEINRKRSDGNRAAWGLPPHESNTMSLSKKQRAAFVRGIGFNASQLRAWLDTSCKRCGATESLELDHIVCMAAGGKSVRNNAQTLCRKCNRWKVKYIDKPLVRQLFQSRGA